jgi:hypothetical protein
MFLVTTFINCSKRIAVKRGIAIKRKRKTKKGVDEPFTSFDNPMKNHSSVLETTTQRESPRESQREHSRETEITTEKEMAVEPKEVTKVLV